MGTGATIKIDTRGFSSMVSMAKTRTVTLKGVKAGAKILQSVARSEAPRRARSGALRQAQGILAKKGSKGLTVSFAVQGAHKRVVKFVRLKGYKTPQKVVPAFYDHLVQGGTKPHRLGKGESLGREAAVTKKGRTYRKTVYETSQTTGGQHPGTQPNPYRRRAWEAVKTEIGNAVVGAMAAEIRSMLAKAEVRKG